MTHTIVRRRLDDRLMRGSTRAVAMLLAGGLALCNVHAQEPEDTAVAAETLRHAKPGAIFRIWPLEGGVRSGYKGYRILYRSTGINDEPVAVTGAVLFPAAGANGPPRPVVAWAHPTTGVVSKCAPTLLPDLSGTIQGVDYLADKGYVAVATDYVGLGTKDHHPYLIGIPAAHAVLDSVRAARELTDVHAGDHFVVWGHSQGGHAALFTGALATSYAPELHLVGVAAAAPATNLAELFAADRATTSGRSLTAMTVLSWSRVFGLPLDRMVEKAALTRFQSLASDCIESISDFFKESHDEHALARQFLTIDPSADPQLRRIMDDNTPGPLPAGTPVFLSQGSADTLVRPQITREYMKVLCKGGAKVKLDILPGGTHMFTGRDSAYAAVDWMTKIFAGHAVPNDC